MFPETFIPPEHKQAWCLWSSTYFRRCDGNLDVYTKSSTPRTKSRGHNFCGVSSFTMFVQKVLHPADMCFKLPENVSLEEGAMCEPLSVGVHTCRRANIGPETRVLVIGGGAIGLVTMLVAKAFGSPRVVIVDTHTERLEFAKKLGADGVLLISRNDEVFFLVWSPAHIVVKFCLYTPSLHNYVVLTVKVNCCGGAYRMWTRRLKRYKKLWAPQSTSLVIV